MCMLCNVHFVTLVFALVGIGTFLYKIGGNLVCLGLYFLCFLIGLGVPVSRAFVYLSLFWKTSQHETTTYHKIVSCRINR